MVGGYGHDAAAAELRGVREVTLDKYFSRAARRAGKPGLGHPASKAWMGDGFT